VRNIIYVQFLILYLLISCTNEQKSAAINKKDILEIAFSYHFQHFQSPLEQQLLLKYKIKSAAFVTERILKNEIDSTTYLFYDKEGRLKSRTTTECTTVGCLPYRIRQEYIYNGNRINRINDYTFKYKYKYVSYYWMLSDLNALSIFDWEDYIYKNDTIRIESGSQAFEYVVDKNENIISKKLRTKTNNQMVEVEYHHSNSNIVWEIKNDLPDKSSEVNYKVTDNNKVLFTRKITPQKIYSTEYIFNGEGLLAEILDYVNNNIESKTKVTYTIYKDKI
jgi:hypothetical protein